MDLEDNEWGVDNLLDKYKGKKIDYLITDKKEFNDMNFLLSSLKSKNTNKYKLGNSFNISKSKLTKNKEKDNYNLNTEISMDINRPKTIDVSLEDKKQKQTMKIYPLLISMKIICAIHVKRILFRNTA